jgi:hypothetical protein
MDWSGEIITRLKGVWRIPHNIPEQIADGGKDPCHPKSPNFFSKEFIAKNVLCGKF